MIIAGNQPQKISRMKHVKTIFDSESRTDMIDFLKREKLKLNRESDLIKLAQYYSKR